MSLSRAQLAAELWGRLQRPFAEVGITNSDTTGNLKEPIDATLLALGTAWGDVATGTVATGDELKAITVAAYYGWEAAVTAAANLVDGSVGAPQVQESASQLTANYTKQRDLAKQAAQQYLPDEGAFVVGVIALDIIEPLECA